MGVGVLFVYVVAVLVQTVFKAIYLFREIKQRLEHPSRRLIDQEVE